METVPSSASAATEHFAHNLRAGLSASEINEMRDLLNRHFEGVEQGSFDRDLADKSHVLRVWKNGRLIGFSTLLVYRQEFGDEVLNLLYSGDTIMDPEGWGSPLLARGWIAMVKAVTSGLPPGRCFWLLLSAGFRTYRFLPVFWREFWPRHDKATPDHVRDLMDRIALHRFGDCYNQELGVVRFKHPHRLRAPLATIPDGRRLDPHVAFFLDRNPGWMSGDELVCLAEIADAKLTSAGRRMIRGLPS